MRSMKKNQIVAGLMLMAIMLPFPLIQGIIGIGSTPSNETITTWIVFSVICSLFLMIVTETTEILKKSDQ